MMPIYQVLSAVESGAPLASDQLLPLVYDELRKLAAAKLAREAPGHTLQPTALVHEAYLRLVSGKIAPQWENQRHFYAAVAETMRYVLVDRARRKRSVKHGGEFRRLAVEDALLAAERASAETRVINEAISELEIHDPRAAEIAKLRFFAGLSLTEAADVMGLSPRTADRVWALAKAWLGAYLTAP